MIGLPSFYIIDKLLCGSARNAAVSQLPLVCPHQKLLVGQRDGGMLELSENALNNTSVTNIVFDILEEVLS